MTRRILLWISSFLLISLKHLIKSILSRFSFGFVLLIVYLLTLFASYSFLQQRAAYLKREIEEKTEQEKTLNSKNFYRAPLGSRTKNISNITQNQYDLSNLVSGKILF